MVGYNNTISIVHINFKYAYLVTPTVQIIVLSISVCEVCRPLARFDLDRYDIEFLKSDWIVLCMHANIYDYNKEQNDNYITETGNNNNHT